MSIRIISKGIVLGLVLTIWLTSLFSFDIQVARGDSLLLEMTVGKTIINVGESVDFSLTLTNIGGNNVTITYTPPLFDVMYCSRGECYRWSDDKAFFQVILELTIEPGENYTQTLSWDLCQYHDGEFYPPEPGEYGLVGMCYHPFAFTRIPIIITVVDADIIVPNDYSTMQEAINRANEGDTIFVGSGTYYENIVINKTLTLIGEERSTTIIDGNQVSNVVNITSDSVTFTCFTVRNSSIHFGSCGIFLESDGNVISDINLQNNTDYGILAEFSSNNIISGNRIADSNCGIALMMASNVNVLENNSLMNNYYGVDVEVSHDNLIMNSIFVENNVGLRISFSARPIISQNIISNNEEGIFIDYIPFKGTNAKITDNTIIENDLGLSLSESSDNYIYHNNFVNNTQQASSYSCSNYWDNGFEGNYWSNYNGSDIDGDGIGDTPYFVDENNTDNYPLMNLYWNPCDINHDLKVDMKDVGGTARAFDTQPGDPDWNPHADITGPEKLSPDGTVDMRDIGLIARDFGKTY